MGKKIACLLDSGCETSVVGRQLIPDAALKPTEHRLFAANGTAIPLVGQVTLNFTVDGGQCTADLAVTEAIDEMVLGVDWLTQNRCRWDFGQSVKD